jgi:alkanesulfonate monooxygenase SsuD/methylene tetrahydromethanopterin reductase-like flavin-dependent oxidoreductase (luciferase family)
MERRMDIGVGLPNTVPGTEGTALTGWAAHAEQAGFSTLGTIGRLVYDGYEELVALAAASAVTSRIRLTTSVLLAPLHRNPVLLAKQAASLDRLSGGRFVLGLGLGGRGDDYTVSGVDMAGRGQRFDAQLETMRRVWRGEERGEAGAVGPAPVHEGGPELILGGSAPASFRRVARVADGWIMGGGTPQMFAQAAHAVDAAWLEAGREGRPRKLSLAYFALGNGARQQADSYLHHYYGWLGEETAGQIASVAAVSEDAVAEYAAAFGDAGCDELIFVPTAADPKQIDQLAEAVL